MNFQTKRITKFLLCCLVYFSTICQSNSQILEDREIEGIGLAIEKILLRLEARRIKLLGELQREICYDNEPETGIGCFQLLPEVGTLPEPPEKFQCNFWLYTRRDNGEMGDMLDFSNVENLKNTSFDPAKPTKVVIHGFLESLKTVWVKLMKDYILEVEDANVIIVNHVPSQPLAYSIHVADGEVAAKMGALLFQNLKTAVGFDPAQLHIIGFSLGAHIAGQLGKDLKRRTGVRPARITGLEPAAPMYENPKFKLRLTKNDADFVDIIHTNGLPMIKTGLGIFEPLGHVDFYPNGGLYQPSCTWFAENVQEALGAEDNLNIEYCTHIRAVAYFLESIKQNSSTCMFKTCPCSKGYESFLQGRCFQCADDKAGIMGYHAKGQGQQYLVTRYQKPFCGKNLLVRILTSKNQKSTLGVISLMLEDGKGNIEVKNMTDEETTIPSGKNFTTVMGVTPEMESVSRIRLVYQWAEDYTVSGSKIFLIDEIEITDEEGNQMFIYCEDMTRLTSNVPKSLTKKPC